MQDLLVVAYYFPPLGLSGVQRVAGFVRNLPACGWQPTVLTARPGGYFAYDESLRNPIEDAGIGVIRTRSLDPTRLFRPGSTVRLPSESRRRILASFSNWLFIPDNKAGWFPFAVQSGIRMAKTRTFRAIFSSAPPYTGHLVARILSKKLGLPLITDFRDDWVGNPRHTYPTGFHRRVHIWMEKNVLLQSSAVTTINTPILNALQKRHPDLPVRGEVIPHGYDEYESPSLRPDGTRLTLVYTGIFYDAQTPDYFLRGLDEYITRYPKMLTKLSVIFAGLVPDGFDDTVRTLGLSNIVQYMGYIKQSEVKRLHQKADILWMTIGSRPGASGISTGKLFEYMGTGKPILALIPPGTAREILLSYKSVYLAAPESTDEIVCALRKIQDDWQKQSFPVPDHEFRLRFCRRHLTQQLSNLLNSVTNQI